MISMKKILLIAGAVLAVSSPVYAAGDSVALPHEEWSFDGPLGTYDKAALQRGLQVYRNVCASCHGLKRVYFRNLEALGYNEAQIKAIAAEYTVEAPEGQELSATQYWNKYMAGHVIAMPAPLSDGQVAYDDDSPQTVDQYARDVAHFLTWAAEPEMEQRKRMGIKVVLYLLVFTAVMYGVKRKIWADVKKK